MIDVQSFRREEYTENKIITLPNLMILNETLYWSGNGKCENMIYTVTGHHIRYTYTVSIVLLFIAALKNENECFLNFFISQKLHLTLNVKLNIGWQKH